MMEFLSFGSGSSGNCYLLRTPNTSILLDAGIGIRALTRHMRDHGVSFATIQAVFITHDHADHIKAVGHLAKSHQLPIYTTATIHDGIDRNYCVTTKVPQAQRQTITKGQAIAFGDLLITPFEISHDSSDCVGYLISQTDGPTLCLVTDCGEVTPIVGSAIGQATHLIIESNHDETMLADGPYPAYLKARITSAKGHLSNRQCAQAITEYATPRLRHVWLCHLSEENNHPELARKTIEQHLREYGIAVGTDFALDVLRRKSPTGIFTLQ